MRVTATEFAKNFGRYQDEAREEPIEVTTHDRTTGYFVSPRAYEEFQELRAKSRQNLQVGALSPETVELIRSSKMSDRHDALNALLDN
ncbi:hypothetical protein V1282_005564 [Nitrobacteraceae bacterium AZCC 2146]